jgi:hypothetical protein
MFRFLRQYRATPHTSTGFTPHRLLFGCEPSTKLPKVQLKTIQDSGIAKTLRQNDERSKTKMKIMADNRNKATNSDLNQGDHVLNRNERRENKLTATFNPEPLTITKKKGSMITTKSGDKQITRNSSLLKKTNIKLKKKKMRKKLFLIPKRYQRLKLQVAQIHLDQRDRQSHLHT